MALVTAFAGRDNAHPPVLPASWWCWVTATCASAVVILAMVARLDAWCVLLAVMVLIVSSPPVVHSLHQKARSRPSSSEPRTEPSGITVKRGSGQRGSGQRDAPSPPTGTPTDPDQLVASLSPIELCHLWRLTYWMLRERPPPARLGDLADVRRAIIDQLEIERPEAVRNWLESGHHLADGPFRYL